MENYELVHWGVRGMRWGVRRYQNKDGTLTAAGKKRYDAEMDKLKKEEKILKNKQRTAEKIQKLEDKKREIESLKSNKAKDDDVKPKKKKISEMSDDELRTKLQRMQMEKQLRDLEKAENAQHVSSGKTFVKDVLEKSGKNIATQVATFAIGSLVNKTLGSMANDPAMVNPKKGQKDK